MQTIDKLAKNRDKFRRKFYYFDRARDGFKAVLDKEATRDAFVFLPSFIGWSVREGSGVFDPVRQSNSNYLFYKLDSQLHVDIADLKSKLATHKVSVFVFIHYFGHVDPNYLEIIKLVKSYKGVILEDEAHAIYTDLVDGSSGRQGDYVIFSLHKMLPEQRGGALVVNGSCILFENAVEKHDILSYDLHAIAKIRKENMRYVELSIKNVQGVHSLWKPVYTETWQTYPVVIESVNRDELYQKMNDAGFGVVSLYHTLIPQIDRTEFKESYEVSKCIMNLPIHQDVTRCQIDQMIKCLTNFLAKTK